MRLGDPTIPRPNAAGRDVAADHASYVGLVPGDTLDDRFVITGVISSGGMATILKARDLKNPNRPVAVKVPHASFANGFGSSSRFQREAEIGSRLNHPGILKFLPINPAQLGSYLVTECLEGCTLEQRLATERILSEKDAFQIVWLLCEAVQYLHEQKVVHYDLKPGNVFLCPDNSIRLLDFGLAQPMETNYFNLFRVSPAMGTPDYVAPEHIRRKPGQPSADIYSLGIILYEMLTGTVPFPGDDPFVLGSVRLTGDPPAPRKLNPDISPQAEEIVLRAMQRNPARRYPTAAAMKADLVAPYQIHVTGLCDRLQPSTPGRRTRRVICWIATYCGLPIASQILFYLWLWLHFTKHW